MLRSNIAPVSGRRGHEADDQLTTLGLAAMGMRHRSIGLRVGILVAVPLLCLVVLYAFAASLTVSNALKQTRATSLRNQVGNPISIFQLEVAAERGLALLSLATPSSPQIAGQLSTQEVATSKALTQMQSAFSSPAAIANASSAELTSMHALVNQGAELNLVRTAVATHAIDMRAALLDYNTIIQSGYAVLDHLIDSESNVQQVTQAIDLVNLDRARQATIAESNLLAADMAMREFPAADRMTIDSLAATRQQLEAGALPGLQASYRAAVDKYVTLPVGRTMTAAEATVADTPWHAGGAPPKVVSASTAFGAYTTALEQGLLAAAAQLQQAAQHQGNTALLQVILVGGIGLIGLIVSIALSLMLGRGLVRQLRALRESALTLANQKLPDLVSQLRAGQQISFG